MKFGYEKVYLPLYQVADIPFHIQGGDIIRDTSSRTLYYQPRLNTEKLTLDLKKKIHVTLLRLRTEKLVMLTSYYD